MFYFVGFCFLLFYTVFFIDGMFYYYYIIFGFLVMIVVVESHNKLSILSLLPKTDEICYVMFLVV